MSRPTEDVFVEGALLDRLEFLHWSTLRLDAVTRNDPEKTGRTCLADVILPRELKNAILRINPWLTVTQADDVIVQLQSLYNHNASLLDNNAEVFKAITTETPLTAIDEETGEVDKPVHLIDFEDAEAFNPETSKNKYLAVSQFKVRIPGTEEHIIPDVVLFVNGLPLVVIECKSPDIDDPIGQGIEQLLRYQNRRNSPTVEGVPELFYYNQLVIVTTKTEAKYSTITGNAAHFLDWKTNYDRTTYEPMPIEGIKPDDGKTATTADQLYEGLLSPSNLLDIIQSYIVYVDDDEGHTLKLAPRYMQYRGALRIIGKLRGVGECASRGTLWHTQGTGKSLTMVFVVRKMHNTKDLADYKIVLIVDRDDLQKQLSTKTKAIKQIISKAGKIEGLKKLLANTASDVVLAMVQKFGETGEKDARVAFPSDLNTSSRILIMIDEAHRSEYSLLATSMWASMPNAVKVAFTGTPIDKTTNKFGGYLDTYTMRQAVADNIVVEIKYEGRATASDITDSEAMNADFLDVFGYIETEEQQKIMGKYTRTGYLQAQQIIDLKATDMVEHYISTIFQNGFKAQIVATERDGAHRYYEAITQRVLPAKIAALEKDNPYGVDIEKLKKLRVACVISSIGNNDKPHLKPYASQDNDAIIDGFKAPFGRFGKKGGDGNFGIIIVADMLLTGFDAPIEQVMYLDKIITGHNLLQAIARVNRTSKNKSCGYVVDYVGVTNHLTEALEQYTDEERAELIATLANFDKDLGKLNESYNAVRAFIRDKIPGRNLSENDAEAIIEELTADEALKNEYFMLVSVFTKYFDRVMPEPEALKYRNDLKLIAFIRQAVFQRTRDPRLSMRDASEKVRAIIEEYLEVQGCSVEIPPVDILDPDFLDPERLKDRSDRAISEEIKYALTEIINRNYAKDPELYERLSDKLKKILEDFKNQWGVLRSSLTSLRQEVIDKRNKEQNFGYDAEHEMPIFALLKAKIFGNISFTSIKKTEFDALKDLTDTILDRLKADTKKVNFWNDEALKANLRTFIINNVLITSSLKPKYSQLFTERKSIAQEILDLGFLHYGRG